MGLIKKIKIKIEKIMEIIVETEPNKMWGRLVKWVKISMIKKWEI